MPKQVDSTFREDESFVYCDITNFTPNAKLDVSVVSKAVTPNESTLGVTGLVQNVTDANGSVTFKFPKDFLLPDLPRSLTCIGPIDVPTIVKA